MKTKDSFLRYATLESMETSEHLHSKINIHDTLQDKIAEKLTNAFGTTGFFVVHVVVFIVWITWNLLPQFHHFDPFPFIFLTVVTSIEAIFLAIIVLMSQNRDARIATTRSKLDFEIDVRSEAEITRIIMMLEEMQDHFNIQRTDDDDLRWMKKPTNIEDLQKKTEEYRDQ